MTCTTIAAVGRTLLLLLKRHRVSIVFLRRLRLRLTCVAAAATRAAAAQAAEQQSEQKTAGERRKQHVLLRAQKRHKVLLDDLRVLERDVHKRWQRWHRLAGELLVATARETRELVEVAGSRVLVDLTLTQEKQRWVSTDPKALSLLLWMCQPSY